VVSNYPSKFEKMKIPFRYVVASVCVLAVAQICRADSTIYTSKAEIRVVLSTTNGDRELGRGLTITIASADLAHVAPAGQPGDQLLIYAVTPVDGDDGSYNAGNMVKDGNRYSFNWLDDNGKPTSRSMTWLGPNS